MEHATRMMAPAQPIAKNMEEGLITKRRKTEVSDESEPLVSLSQQKSNLSREMVSKATFLLRQAAILRSDNHLPLTSEKEQQISAIFAQHIGSELLRMHKQLDHIAAEHSKVQIMLEQIRRCNATPYPAWDPSQHISAGLKNVGPMVEFEGSYVMPYYPDRSQMPHSPYMEHYEKWLLPARSIPPKVIVEEQLVSTNRRCTRNSSQADFVTNTPSTYATEAQESSEPELHPLIRKNSKGEWVLLQCRGLRKNGTSCDGASDFKTIQGMINHVRIDHDVSHRSHLAIADACGKPIELSEELERAYLAAERRKLERSRKGRSNTAIKLDNDAPEHNAVQQTEVVGVVKLAPPGTKSALEIAEDKGYVYTSTVHPFNKPGAIFPAASDAMPDGEEEAKVGFSSQSKRSLAGAAQLGRCSTPSAFNAVVSDPEFPYLSQLLQARASKSLEGTTLDLKVLVDNTRKVTDTSRKELSSRQVNDEETPKVPGKVTRAKTQAKVQATPQDPPRKRGRPRKEKTSNVGSTDIPGSKAHVSLAPSSQATYTRPEPTYARPHPLRTPASAKPPPVLGTQTLRSDSWPLSLSSVRNSSADPRGMALPGLVSDHGSVADELEETDDFRYSMSGEKKRIRIEDDDDHVKEMDAPLTEDMDEAGSGKDS